MVTPALFEAYPTPQAMALATPDEVFAYIKSVSYPNNKSKHLVAWPARLSKSSTGVVPSEVDELQKLPGVGRKTANVVASVVFHKEAMAVDTHVFRVSNRIGLTNNSKTPLETEKTLVKNIPSHLLPIAHHWLILHGRYVCTARKPNCLECGIREYCKFYTPAREEERGVRIAVKSNIHITKKPSTHPGFSVILKFHSLFLNRDIAFEQFGQATRPRWSHFRERQEPTRFVPDAA